MLEVPQARPGPRQTPSIAPLGTLGVVLNSTKTGPSYVRSFKDNCPLRDWLEVRDTLVAVDDKDVSVWTAIWVSKLL